MLSQDIEKNTFTAELDGRDRIVFTIYADYRCELSAVGCASFLSLIQSKISSEGTDPRGWALPTENSHVDILVREIILKSKGQWSFPYIHDELCHCRAIPAHKVDQAIVAGAHDCASVSRQTGASTACGTCRPDVQKIIDYRLA